MRQLLEGRRDDKGDVLARLRGQAERERGQRRENGAKAWKDWALESWEGGGRDLYEWIKERRDPPIVTARREDGSFTLNPDEVNSIFTSGWSELWQPRAEGERSGEPWNRGRGWREGERERCGCPALTGGRVRAAVREIGGRKAAGPDAWAFADLKRLPDAATNELAELLNRVEQEGAWPRQLRGATVVMLPKGEGGQPLGQRPIGLLASTYRIWARIRVADLKQRLEAERREEETGGKPGVGAEETALWAALDTEAAGGRGDRAATAFIDVSKCYETVDLRAAHAAAVREGWPETISYLVFQQYGAGRRIRVAGAIGKEVHATRGIIAGCGFAVYALGAYMRPILRAAGAWEPGVKIRTYVDDIRIDAVHERDAAGMVGRARDEVVRGLARLGLKAHPDKTHTIGHDRATVGALGRHRGTMYGAKKTQGKDLGVDVHGRRRAVRVLKGRLLKGVQRAQRTARLPIGRAGRARVAAAGINRAVMYGLGVTGISEGDLRKWRSAVVKAVAPDRAARTCTRATLVLAAKQEIDPAVVAPMEVVGNWARAVWAKGRVPREAEEGLDRYPRDWRRGLPPRAMHRIRGPMGALCQAAGRQGWTVVGPGEFLVAEG